MADQERELLLLPTDAISPNPDQPRSMFSPDELDRLAESIRENGVLQPILVRQGEAGYILIAGERRWRAAILAGLARIPAILEERTPDDAALLALIENMQRSDLTFFEEAVAIKALLERTGLTQEEAARRLGMSQSALANKLRLLRLSPAERQIILENGLSERHARALLRAEDENLRGALLKETVTRRLNVAQTESLVSARVAAKAAQKRPKRIFIAKDVRLFLNTFDRAVTVMKAAGIRAVSQRRETDEYFECVVRIPKSDSSTR